MNLEQQLQKKVKEYTFHDGITQEDSMFLNGCMGLYNKNCNAEILKKIEEYTEARLCADGMDLIKLGNTLRFLYENTQKDCYMAAIEKIMTYIRNTKNIDGILEHEDGSMITAVEAYEILPIYAWYETNFNRKERYIDIMKQISYFNDQMLMKNTMELHDQCTFMMALADTITCMSEEIYEYYEQIKTWLKDAVHKRLPVVNSDCLMLAYSILKGCKSKSLLPEKYEKIGKGMFYQAADKLLANKGEDKEELGILLMTYALI